MSPLFPSITAKDLIRIVRKCGFLLVRQKGSHQIWKHPDGRWTTIPVHPGENIGRGLLRKILNDLEISSKEFLQMLRKK